MGNQASTAEQQIIILRQRGMIIHKDDKAKEILLDIGYYRLGFYWFFFETAATRMHEKAHLLQEGTSFDDVVKLYYLDVDLRNLLLKYIHRMEINFRTKLVYKVSNQHPDIPAWYANGKVVNSEFIRNLPRKTYTENFKRIPILKRHHIKYPNHKYAPAWKAIEFFSFGAAHVLYEALLDGQLKIDIAGEYGYKDSDKFSHNLQAIIRLRNVCSHGGTLIDFNQSKGIMAIPDKSYPLTDSHSIYASITLLRFFLSKISLNRANVLENAVCKLFDDFRENQKIRKILTEKSRYDF